MSMFNRLLGGKVKITKLEGHASWDHKVGKINYSESQEVLMFKEDDKGARFEFIILEMDETNMTFKTANGFYQIEPI